MAAGFERVFEIGPAFRADPSFTSRHMTEFTSVDMEMSWIDSHEDVMAFMERWLVYVSTTGARDLRAGDLRPLWGGDRPADAALPAHHHGEALRDPQGAGYTLPPEKKGDIDPAGERILGQYVKEQVRPRFLLPDRLAGSACGRSTTCASPKTRR